MRDDLDRRTYQTDRFETILQMIQDLTRELRLEFVRIQSDALSDPLTGLGNRRFLDQRLEQEVSRAKRYGHPLSIALLDIDRFKNYNDQFGHRAGDELLRRLGCLIRREVREPDVVARYGGEEFALILPETDREGALHVIRRLRRRVRDDVRIPLTISFGLAEFPTHGEDPLSLLDAADRALYAAKEAGRDTVCDPDGVVDWISGASLPVRKPASRQSVQTEAEAAEAASSRRRVAVGFKTGEEQPVSVWEGRRMFKVLGWTCEDGPEGEEFGTFRIQTEMGDFRLVRRQDGWYLEK